MRDAPPPGNQPPALTVEEARNEIAAHFVEQKEKLNARIEAKQEVGANVASQLDKTIISLSGGALVFSMTFVDKLAPANLGVEAAVRQLGVLRCCDHCCHACDACRSNR